MKEKHLPALYFLCCDLGMIACAAGLAYFMKTDYNGIGVCAICAVYLLRKYPKTGALLCAVILMASSEREIFALAAIIPISLYNGKRGKQLKYLFYLAYPVHLLILYLLRIPFGI